MCRPLLSQRHLASMIPSSVRISGEWLLILASTFKCWRVPSSVGEYSFGPVSVMWRVGVFGDLSFTFDFPMMTCLLVEYLYTTIVILDFFFEVFSKRQINN